VDTMLLRMAGPRASLSRSVWKDAMRSESSLRPLYRPAFSAGGVRYEMVAE